ncbi:MAG TPA: MnhB domain-containing protein [Gaiellaceae bacterium]|nr:MnhB domain-containing protein [Gaiellaceae bacterium]
MTRRARIAVFVPALAGLAALFLWGFAGIPDFGHYRGPYGFVLNRIVVPDRHTTNVVGATVFDVRGVDTMGEEFILFAAVMGVVLLLRSGGAVPDDDPVPRFPPIRFGVLATGACVLVGVWLVAFGYVTPGGGFQGGVAVAAGALVLYLATNFRHFEPFADETILDPLEATGAGGYVVVGLAALVSGAPFLHNLLGPGQSGTVMSGGSIAFLNWAAAVEVAAANLVLFAEFLKEQA